jgi:hypothetical protein
MNESHFLTSGKRMDVNRALLFVAACPSFCIGHRLRNSDTLSLSVEAAVTFPGDAAPEFCAAEALPVRRMPNPAFIFAFKLVGHSVAFEAVAYVGVCVLVSMLLFAAQMKTSNSRAILDAQRLLHLVPSLRTP